VLSRARQIDVNAVPGINWYDIRVRFDQSSVFAFVPPAGYVFLLGADGSYLLGADGAYLLGAA